MDYTVAKRRQQDPKYRKDWVRIQDWFKEVSQYPPKKITIAPAILGSLYQNNCFNEIVYTDEKNEKSLRILDDIIEVKLDDIEPDRSVKQNGIYLFQITAMFSEGMVEILFDENDKKEFIERKKIQDEAIAKAKEERLKIANQGNDNNLLEIIANLQSQLNELKERKK